MEYQAVYGATILATVLGTLALGLIANVPYAQSAGIGLGSLFTYTICGSMGYTWQQALAMVFICAVINLMITLTSIRKKIITSIPTHLQEAITVGIGLFITYIGLMNAGLIEFQAESVKNGFAQENGGAIYIEKGEIRIMKSAITENTAKYGGSIYNDEGIVIIKESSLIGNLAKSNGRGNAQL